MEEQKSVCEQTFPVVCVWCGSEIRRGSTPECPAMCQPCFKRMVDEHTLVAARQQPHAHASER